MHWPLNQFGISAAYRWFFDLTDLLGTQLEVIDFSGNLMERLPDRGFLKQRKLLQLRLDDNLVRNVSNATAFVGLQSLTKLSLKGNRLEVIQAKTFEFLPKVKLSLDLFVPEHVRHTVASYLLDSFYLHFTLHTRIKRGRVSFLAWINRFLGYQRPI